MVAEQLHPKMVKMASEHGDKEEYWTESISSTEDIMMENEWVGSQRFYNFKLIKTWFII